MQIEIRHKRKKSSGGYTIIEVIVSLFIIAICLIIYGASANSVTLNRFTSHQDLARRVADSAMEDMRSYGYGNLPGSGPWSSPLLGKLPGGSAYLNVSDYNTDTKEVLITVTWAEPGQSQASSVTMVTLVNKNGI